MIITIITATYNSCATVRDTVCSVMQQSFNDWKMIIKDGVSKDSTLNICSELAEKAGGTISIISGHDDGIYDAMNQGINMADGDIIGILNSDDFYTSNDVLYTVAKAFEEDPTLEAVYGDVHYCKADDIAKPVRYYSSKFFRPWLMRLGFMPAHPSFYVRREVFEKYGLFDPSYKIAADFDLLLRFIFINRIKTKYIEKDFVTMREGGASSSGIKSHMQINKEHLACLRKNGVRSNLFLLSLRYFYKLYELAISRLKYR